MKNEQADQIEERLIDFGARIIFLSDKRPQTRASQHVVQQIVRAGTSPAPNHGEARGAESRADFVHKPGIALKELSETKVWLKMIVRAKMTNGEAVDSSLRNAGSWLGSSTPRSRPRVAMNTDRWTMNNEH